VPEQPDGRQIRSSFTFVDLFAGIGGMRIGLARAGGKCVYSCEIDPYARRTYLENFDLCEGHDIRDVVAQDIPEHDVLAAGFPCQPFSIAGVTKKLSLGRPHGFDDERSGNLFFEIVRIATAKRPSVLLLENVKNLRSHDRGRTFRTILAELAAIGYNVSHQVVDARSWVPQHRERTFIVGLDSGRFGDRQFVFPAPPPNPEPRLREILEPSWPAKYVLSEHLWKYLQDYKSRHRAAGNGFGFGLVTGDQIARTLSARYYKDGSEILVDTQAARPRRLTPTECARLMGFPNPLVGTRAQGEPRPEKLVDFYIPVSDTQAYKQFGNAVVVDVVQFIATAITAQTAMADVTSVAA
jgi:DNA (cytosine-5)-methyltransferase 1